MSKEKKERQMSFAEVSHVNHFQSQANRKERVTTDISGQKCLDSLGRSNPNSLLGRMSKILLTSKTAWSSKLCALTWKVKATKFNRSIFQLQVSVLPTEEKESGLWLTPSATMRSNRSKKAMEHRIKYRASVGRRTVPPGSLAEQIQYGKPITDMKQMWPTPTAATNGPGKNPNNKRGIHQGNALATAVSMYPTPRASKAMSENMENIKRRGVDKARLEERIAMMPTPTARDWKDSGLNTNYETARKKSRLAGTAGGALNPMWVEWLMGYPAEYTDLKDWEMLSSRKSQKK